MAESEDDQAKSEVATPRRREEARERGQVALSHEVVTVAVLLAGVLVFAIGGGAIAANLAGLVARGIKSAGLVGAQPLDLGESAALVGETLWPALQWLLVLVVPLFALALLSAYGQVGFRITPKALTLDAGKLSPVKNWGRIASSKSLVRTLFSLGKLAFICTAMAWMAWAKLEDIARLSSMELWPALACIGRLVLWTVGAGIGAIAVIALGDLLYQRWQHERDLRMSRQELRQELRHTEGDPHVKARIRRVQRELASRRMMADVPKATVVVTNPTHFAVALRYDRQEAARSGGAPKVVAKGVDQVAERIKEVAREAGVIVYEDAPLARTLHARCEIGDEVPFELYQAVAGVLSYVYRIRGAPRAA